VATPPGKEDFQYADPPGKPATAPAVRPITPPLSPPRLGGRPAYTEIAPEQSAKRLASWLHALFPAVAEVPITFVERRQGESKLSRGVIVESIWKPWLLVASSRTE